MADQEVQPKESDRLSLNQISCHTWSKKSEGILFAHLNQSINHVLLNSTLMNVKKTEA